MTWKMTVIIKLWLVHKQTCISLMFFIFCFIRMSQKKQIFVGERFSLTTASCGMAYDQIINDFPQESEFAGNRMILKSG